MLELHMGGGSYHHISKLFFDIPMIFLVEGYPRYISLLSAHNPHLKFIVGIKAYISLSVLINFVFYS